MTDANYPSEGYRRAWQQEPAVRVLPLNEIDADDPTVRFVLEESSTGSLASELAENGQREPIQVMESGSRYRILDGVRRVAAARELCWHSMLARVYGPMEMREARRVSLRSNVAARDLTVGQKNAVIKKARREGYTKAEVAEILSLSPRQVERYLAIPDSLLQAIDAREITMAHARVLNEYRAGLSPEDLAELTTRIRGEGITAARLSAMLHDTAGGGVSGSLRPVSLGHVSKERVRIYNLDIVRAAPRPYLESAIRMLRDAITQLEEFERVGGVEQSSPITGSQSASD